MVRNVRPLTIFLGIAALMLLTGVPASAQCPSASISYNFHQPVTQTLYNFCAARGNMGFSIDPVGDSDPIPSNADPNALVTLNGEYFIEQHFEVKPNGDCHAHQTTHYNVNGQNAQGIQYVGKDQQNYDLRLDPDGTGAPTSDLMSSDNFKLIAQGPTPDLKMTQKLHTTVRVDKSGNVVINVVKDGNPIFKCK